MKKKKYNFCIVTYETFPNPITQNLKTFLLENYNCDILYIFHPMLDMKEGYELSSGYHFYQNNQLAESRKSHHWQLYWPSLYIKDVLYTFFWCLKFKRKFDVYFACGNLNPIAGIILRKFGFVKKVVYQSIDYYPERFSNKFLNFLYFQLDKFCVRFADETWNVSPQTAETREQKMGMNRKIYNRQFTVPGTVWFFKTKRVPFTKINRKKIVYRGMLLDYMGVDLAIKALPFIIKKFPNVIFEIVGTGEEEKNLKNLAKSLVVSQNVIFHGFVEKRGEVEKILSNAALGIATFNTEILSDKMKNSDPGKIKDYMLLGMPVITTDAFPSIKEIVENRCGLVVPYKEEDLAENVIKLVGNKNLLQEYRENALKFIEKFDCNKILKPNVERVLNANPNF